MYKIDVEMEYMVIVIGPLSSIFWLNSGLESFGRVDLSIIMYVWVQIRGFKKYGRAGFCERILISQFSTLINGSSNRNVNGPSITSLPRRP